MDLSIPRLLRQRSAPYVADEADWIDYDDLWKRRVWWFAHSKRDTTFVFMTFVTPVFFDYRKVWSARCRAEIKRARAGFKALARVIRMRQECRAFRIIANDESNADYVRMAARIAAYARF
jgi:hypothetical protein